MPDADGEAEDEENEDKIEKFMINSTDDVLISDANDDSDANFNSQKQDDDIVLKIAKLMEMTVKTILLTVLKLLLSMTKNCPS